MMLQDLIIIFGLLCTLFIVMIGLLYVGLSLYINVETYVIKRRLESVDETVARGDYR